MTVSWFVGYHLVWGTVHGIHDQPIWLVIWETVHTNPNPNPNRLPCISVGRVRSHILNECRFDGKLSGYHK